MLRLSVEQQCHDMLVDATLSLSLHCHLLPLQAVWMLWRIALPLYYFDISVAEFTALFLISEWMTGYYLAFNFQVGVFGILYTQ